MFRTSKIVLSLLVVIVSFILGVSVNKCSTSPTEVLKVDTVFHTVHDTIVFTKTINHSVHHYDTVLIDDTVYIKDLPQLYTDSTKDYSIEINAVKLYDYSLSLYKDTVFVETTKEVKVPQKYKLGQTLSLGLQVGYGLGISPPTMKCSFGPYIGIGISYGFGISW